MNLERLLQHFDRISEAPDTIPRLRQFILDLAVRGKLVEQDPNDEPASELLKRVEAEKERLITAGKIRKQPPLPKNQHGGRYSRIPPSWKAVELIDIVYLRSGIAVEHGDEMTEDHIPYVKVADLSLDANGNGIVTSSRFIGEKYSDSIIESGSIVFPKRGGAIATNRKRMSHVEIVCDSNLMAMKPFLCETTDYLQLWFSGFDLWKLNSGTSVPQINNKDIYPLSMPLPPLAEQHRIVAKVDELMALCDQLEAAKTEREQSRDRLVAASLHSLNSPADAEEANAPEAFRDHARFVFNHLPHLTARPEHIKQLRQTILNLAVRGKLVPQDPNDEPAAELLKRIEEENLKLVKQGTIKRHLSVMPIKENETISGVPDNWNWVRLSNLLLGDSQNGYSKKPDDALDGIPILRISAGTVRKDGIVAEEEHKLIGGISVPEQQQYQLRPGDLLACRFNGNRSFVGRLSLYTGYLGIKPIYPDKLIRLRLFSQFVLPKLVMYFAESNNVRKDIESYCATTVGNWGISASNLKEIKIPLPPLAEQHRIVTKMDELMVLCDQLESQLITTEADSHRLLEAVLHEALAPALEETA